MKSIFDKKNYEELSGRLQKLSASSRALWGKMDNGQMLHHLNLAMEAPLGKSAEKGSPVFFMKLFRSVLYNDKPFGKGSPTARQFKVTEKFDFDKEKEKCIANLKEVFDKNIHGPYQPHVFFGKLTNEQWGKHFYKHLEHHLRQFGV